VNKNLIQRLEHIEDVLENDLKNDGLSPALQEVVDRIRARANAGKGDEQKAKDAPASNIHRGSGLSPEIQIVVDRVAARVSGEEEGGNIK
jgi:hypothetical protein